MSIDHGKILKKLIMSLRKVDPKIKSLEYDSVYEKKEFNKG
jgi:hypothetical protein